MHWGWQIQQESEAFVREGEVRSWRDLGTEGPRPSGVTTTHALMQCGVRDLSSFGIHKLDLLVCCYMRVVKPPHSCKVFPPSSELSSSTF